MKIIKILVGVLFILSVGLSHSVYSDIEDYRDAPVKNGNGTVVSTRLIRPGVCKAEIYFDGRNCVMYRDFLCQKKVGAKVPITYIVGKHTGKTLVVDVTL